MVRHKLATLAYLIYENREKQEAFDEVLLLYRNKKENDFHRGKFLGIGGRLEPGETPLECILRELKEETGHVLTPQEVSFRGYIYFDEIHRDKKTEDILAFNWLVFMYTGRVHTREIFINNPEGELKWFKTDKIPYEKMWEGDKYFTPKLLETDEIIESKFLYEKDKISSFTFGR